MIGLAITTFTCIGREPFESTTALKGITAVAPPITQGEIAVDFQVFYAAVALFFVLLIAVDAPVFVGFDRIQSDELAALLIPNKSTGYWFVFYCACNRASYR
jgi:hypothetical protein